METLEDAGMRWARRSGMIRQIDRATRALKAAAHHRALTDLRLFPGLDGARASARHALKPAVQAGASDRDRPEPQAPSGAVGVAGAVGIAQAGVAGPASVPGVRRGGVAGPDTAGAHVAPPVAHTRKPGGGGLKLVLYPPPLQADGTEPRTPPSVGAHTPTVRRADTIAGMQADAPRSEGSGARSAGASLGAKNSLAPVRSWTDHGVGGGADTASADAAQTRRPPAFDMERLLARSSPALASAAAMARPPLLGARGQRAPMAAIARTARSAPAGATSVAEAPAGSSADGGASQAAGQGRSASTMRSDGGDTGGAAGPVTGDVYLDGTLMGRWMARSLAAEAARPASGSAAFDPRRNAFPTGAMIGG